MPETKKKPVEICLRVTTSRSSGDYVHVDAAPVYRGKNFSGQECWRSFGDYDSPNGLYLNNLTITSQGDKTTVRTDGSPRLYAWDVEYLDSYAVDLDRAKRMAATLITVDKRLRKLTDTLGSPPTFGAYVARVAAAIGATLILAPPSAERQRRGLDQELAVWTPGVGASRIDQLVEELLNPAQVEASAG